MLKIRFCDFNFTEGLIFAKIVRSGQINLYYAQMKDNQILRVADIYGYYRSRLVAAFSTLIEAKTGNFYIRDPDIIPSENRDYWVGFPLRCLSTASEGWGQSLIIQKLQEIN